ncbi:MAG: hypothetical protein M2R45_01958 [Verrucomicrobia subdivision 3 bacterium]|nr:hypothetical protein [Limisphaerales bacterium]MCS1416175.1 hypothetical protein [Limisphaerales bacterium]
MALPNGPFGRRRAASEWEDFQTPILNVTGYAHAGDPFPLQNLKGNYSVIVFGCLT